MNITNKKVADLIPYARNPRKNDQAVDAVAASIKEFGFKVPIIIDSENVIVAGHTRLKAAQKLKLKDVPCVVADDLTPEQVKALRILDNKVSEVAEWDNELLQLELSEMPGFDFGSFGVEFPEVDSMLNDEQNENEDQENEIELTGEDVDNAWRLWAGEVYEQTNALLEAGKPPFHGITKGFATIKFLEAQKLNKEYPRYCSFAFHPHQALVSGSKKQGSMLTLLDKVAKNKVKINRLQFLLQNKMGLNALYTVGLGIAGHRNALDFPATLATELYNKYANSGKVLDPCHGWGGRLVGFLLSNATEYLGIDCSPETSEGTKQIYNAFSGYCIDKKAKFICEPFENAKINNNYFDFALTSPPYFDVEQDIGGEQSYTKYSNYKLWKEGFYETLIQKTHSALKANGVFALQVGSQSYPLKEDGEKIAKKVGFVVENIEATGICNNFTKTEEQDGEVILILRKQNKK